MLAARAETTRTVEVLVPTTPDLYRLSLRSENGSGVIANEIPVQVVPQDGRSR
jgi:hypothetical protein